MPRKHPGPRKVGRPRKAGRRKMRGNGLWDAIKSGLSTVNNLLKKTKVISTVANSINHPYAKTIGNFASSLGYGRRRRRR